MIRDRADAASAHEQLSRTVWNNQTHRPLWEGRSFRFLSGADRRVYRVLKVTFNGNVEYTDERGGSAQVIRLDAVIRNHSQGKLEFIHRGER